MTDDTPIYNVPTIFVTANDGTLFTCTAYRMAEATDPTHLRWRLTDSAGTCHMGPTYVRGESPLEVQRRVAEWWDACKLLRDIAMRRGE